MKYVVKDGLRCHYVRTKFHKDWFRHSKVNRGGGIHRQRGYHVSLLSVFENKASRLKTQFAPHREHCVTVTRCSRFNAVRRSTQTHGVRALRC
jgi:hypothetical protein